MSEDMNLPGLRLHPLKGDLKGFWAVDVSRKTLSALLNGRFGISPEMAIRLSKGFGGSAESWLIQQTQYDLWQALQNTNSIKVKAFAR